MLYIQCKGSESTDCITAIDSYFNRHKDKDWFNNQLVKDIIFDIDKSNAVKDEYIESPIFGGMSPERLSTGCKGVILSIFTDRPIYGTSCGDNCSKWFYEVSKNKDVHLVLHHCMKFPDNFTAIMEDTVEIISSDEEFVSAYYRIRHNRRG